LPSVIRKKGNHDWIVPITSGLSEQNCDILFRSSRNIAAQPHCWTGTSMDPG